MDPLEHNDEGWPPLGPPLGQPTANGTVMLRGRRPATRGNAPCSKAATSSSPSGAQGSPWRPRLPEAIDLPLGAPQPQPWRCRGAATAGASAPQPRTGPAGEQAAHRCWISAHVDRPVRREVSDSKAVNERMEIQDVGGIVRQLHSSDCKDVDLKERMRMVLWSLSSARGGRHCPLDGLQVESVRRIPPKSTSQATSRSSSHQEPSDQAKQSSLLLHGTSWEAARKIVEQRAFPAERPMIYFAETSSKAHEYAVSPKDERCHVLLCDVQLGETTSLTKAMALKKELLLRLSKTSTCVRIKDDERLVVKSTQQVQPLFLVTYRVPKPKHPVGARRASC